MTVTTILLDAWDEVSPGWDADAKRVYYQKHFFALTDLAEQVAANNLALERYAQQCAAEAES